MPEFDRMIDANEFVEWAPVFGYRYGTPKAPVKQALREGRDILFDIDWQGTQQLEPRFGEHLVTHLPPAAVDGRARAAAAEPRHGLRSSDRRPNAARRRRDRATGPNMNMCSSTATWTRASRKVRTIVAPSGSKRARQTGLVDFVRDLIGPQH